MDAPDGPAGKAGVSGDAIPPRENESPRTEQSHQFLLSYSFIAELNSTSMIQKEQLHRRLAELESEHRDLDGVISRVADTAPFDQLQLQRLKKRKLMLKDEIIRVRGRLLPDIIA